MTYNCDRCGEPTDETFKAVGKNGKPYTMYICQSGLMKPGNRFAYGFFPPRDKSQSSLPSTSPVSRFIERADKVIEVVRETQGPVNPAQKEGYLEFKLSKIEKKIDSILSLLTKPEEVVEPITEEYKHGW